MQRANSMSRSHAFNGITKNETDLTLRWDEKQTTMNILRFITAGSVDDGKSTLIGRLLYDSQAVSHDILHTLERQSKNKQNGEVDLALLTDGLRAEREQGITIDVAYKYFNTPKRKFIIADAPGHVQYTRNMVTGASNADLVIILVDARLGVVEQTYRHSLIASIMGIKHFVIAINKMDLVKHEEHTFKNIVQEYQKLATKIDVHQPVFIPISALSGDNVVKSSANMPWYKGPTLLQQLEELHIEPVDLQTAPRFQVQYVIRPQSNDLHDYRGYAGSLRSGQLKRGQRVTVLPAGIETTIKSLEVNRQEVDAAFAPQAIVVHLNDDIDVSRGDFIVPADDLPASSIELDATLCWMSERPLHVGDRFLLRHHSASVKAVVKAIEYRWDVHQYSHEPVERLGLNDIASVRIRTARPIHFDPYTQNRNTGSFILVHEHNFDTVAAGMLHEIPAPEPITDFAI